MINVNLDIDRGRFVGRMINDDLDMERGLFADRMINVGYLDIKC